VFGVPRSGTKGLARALNLHPNVYCSSERFPYSADHAALVFPDSFLATRDIRDRYRLRKRDRVARELAAKPDVRLVGNKTPRYYFALERINRELPHLKNLWIYRSPGGFMQSWNRKEATHQASANWNRGQVGVFGLLELLCCLDATARLEKDVFVFPYEAGLNRSAEPITQALDFLGADPSRFDHAVFAAEHLPRRREGTHRLPPLDHERELLEALDVRALDGILDQPRAFLLASVRSELREYLALVADRLPAALDRAFRGYGDPAVLAYGAAYLARHRRELEPVVSMAAGSAVVADLRRYGITQRLRSLYFQRGTYAKKITTVRLPV
jgi:hypothetical protein